MTAPFAPFATVGQQFGSPLAGLVRPLGEPGQIARMSVQQHDQARAYKKAAEELKADAQQALAVWEGAAATAFETYAQELCLQVLTASEPHDSAGLALGEYSVLLQSAQDDFDTAAALGATAVADEHTASQQAASRAANPGVQVFAPAMLPSVSPLRAVARAQAEAAVTAAATAAARCAKTLLDLTLATEAAPPAVPEQQGQLAGFGSGLKDGVVGPAKLLGGLVGLNGDTSDNWSNLGAGVKNTVANPLETGKAAVGWEDLQAGNYGHWAGELVPGVLAAAATGGGAAALRTSKVVSKNGVVDANAFANGKPIRLADGSRYKPLSPKQQKLFEHWWDSLPVNRDLASGPALDYQKQIYPGDERIVNEKPKTIADGATPRYGAVGDAKFRGKDRSYLVPDSLPEGQRGWAQQDMDNRLLKYDEVVKSSANPARVLEIVTNDLGAAVAWSERIRALGVRGYVRLEPASAP